MTPENYTKHVLLISKKIYGTVIRRKSLIYKIVLLFSITLLLLTTTYAAFHTSNYLTTWADAISNTQLFSGNLQGHTVALPAEHANILKIPLFYAQGHLPYHYTSFTLVNIGLNLVTIVAWAFLLIKLFGRRYEVPILILLASLVFTSVQFNLAITETTIRNIEYPIALWFVFIVNRLLKNLRYSRRQLIFAAIGSVLFCLTLAGDGLFYYAILLPLILVIAWYWIQSREITVSMAKAIGLVVGVIIGAALIKVLLTASGTIIFNSSGGHFSHLTTTLTPIASVGIALKQLMELQGGFIFGQVVRPHNLAIFLNFVILAISIIGLILIIVKASRSYRNKKGFIDNNNFIFVTMAVSYFVLFFLYILSGSLAIWLISFLPLISIIGFVWLLKNYYREHRAFLFIIFTVLLISIAASYPNTSSAYKLEAQQESTARTSINSIITILKSNNVHEIVTGGYYGPPIRFWSNNSIGIAIQQGCGQPMPWLSREDWFTPQKGIKSAIITARTGADSVYWNCSNDQLIRVYGKPSKELLANGLTPGTYVNIWIYNYDVRQYLLPFSMTK